MAPRWVDAVVPVQAPAESRAQRDLLARGTECLSDGTAADSALNDVHGDAGLDRENDLRDLVRRTGRIDVPVYLATSYFDRLVPAAFAESAAATA